MTKVAFEIPGAPEGKRRPRVHTFTGRPIVHSHPADVQRERLIRQHARAAMEGLPPFEGPVRIDIEAVFEPAPSASKKKREALLAAKWHTSKPDKDNIEKSILDGLNPDPKAKLAADRAPFCLTDDAQVAAGYTVKRWGSPARVIVVIYTLEPERIA